MPSRIGRDALYVTSNGLGRVPLDFTGHRQREVVGRHDSLDVGLQFGEVVCQKLLAHAVADGEQNLHERCRVQTGRVGTELVGQLRDIALEVEKRKVGVVVHGEPVHLETGRRRGEHLVGNLRALRR